MVYHLEFGEISTPKLSSVLGLTAIPDKICKSTHWSENAGNPCAGRRQIFRGKGYGAKGECYGEVVFNTSITGYQEIFTDPSYSGQIVVLTNPQIGNYGTNQEDNEATRPWIEGLIVREFSKVSSNWRSQQVTEEYLEQFKVPVLSDIDTRAWCGICATTA